MSSTSTSSRLWDFSLLNFPLRTAGLAFLVAGLSYLVANLGGAFVVRPEMVWPFWPGNVMLLSVLLLAERRMWPLLIVAGLSGFAIYDFQAGLSLRVISLLVLADGVEIIIAAFSIRYLFEGIPKLNTVRNFARYSLFVVFLAPASAAFIGALTTNGSYWTGWRVAYLAEALGLLVLMPAIFGLIEHFSSPRVKPRSYYLEAALLFACLSSLGLLTVALHSRTSAPLLVY